MNNPKETSGERNVRGSSYKDILRSSFIMGGVSALTMVFSLIRIKVAALTIGASGTGMLANLSALQAVLTSAASLGIYTSAVRDIARANGAGEEGEVGRAVLTIRRTCWATGLAGGGATLLLSSMLSRISFGTTEYQWEIALLSMTVLLGNLQGGQTAVMQGMRKIADLATVQVLAAMSATAIMVVSLLAFGIAGLVPALVLSSFVQLAVSWLYCRRIPVVRVPLTLAETFTRSKGMARLGFAIMWTGLLGSAVTYGVTALVANQLSLAALGFYGAAYSLSGVFVNFVLGAMATDFYPRLASLGSDHSALNRLVNEQTEVGLLLAMPGLVATVAFAPWIIQLFYAAEFLPAAQLLQWFCIGCFGRVISWPLGYMLLAKAQPGTVIAIESVCSILHLALVYVALLWFGVLGAAIAFVTVYVVYTVLLVGVTHRMTAFAWTRACIDQIVISAALIAAAWAIAEIDSLVWRLPLGALIIASTSVYSLHALANRLGEDHRITRMIARVPFLRYASPKRGL